MYLGETRNKLTYSYTHYVSLNESLVSNEKNAKNPIQIGFILHSGNWSYLKMANIIVLVFSQAPECKTKHKLCRNCMSSSCDWLSAWYFASLLDKRILGMLI